MTNKVVKVRHFYTYTSNGCDCCEPTEWDSYQVYGCDMVYNSMEDLMEGYLRREFGVSFEVDYEE